MLDRARYASDAYLLVRALLDDCTLDNGCLWVLPHSEQRGLQPHESVGGLRGVIVDEPGVALPMQAGDAVLFGGWCSTTRIRGWWPAKR